jgi:hypothetical protein
VGPRTGLDRRGKSRPPTGVRSSDRPARSQSLYRLRYPAHKVTQERKITEEDVSALTAKQAWGNVHVFPAVTPCRLVVTEVSDGRSAFILKVKQTKR